METRPLPTFRSRPVEGRGRESGREINRGSFAVRGVIPLGVFVRFSRRCNVFPAVRRARYFCAGDGGGGAREKAREGGSTWRDAPAANRCGIDVPHGVDRAALLHGDIMQKLRSALRKVYYVYSATIAQPSRARGEIATSRLARSRREKILRHPTHREGLIARRIVVVRTLQRKFLRYACKFKITRTEGTS